MKTATKWLLALLVLATALCMALATVSCVKSPEDNNTPVIPDTPSIPDTPTLPPLPTASEIVAARKAANSDPIQGYDFTLAFTGNFSVLGLGTSLGGNYDGAYRYDSNSNQITFKRQTSGTLLSDSTCYIFSSGDNRIKAIMDGDTIKKLSVAVPEEQNITMVNLPFVAILDSTKAENIKNITATKNSSYDYSCQLSAGTGNPAYSLLCSVFEMLGTGISFENIALAGSMSKLDFNIKNGKLEDFRLNCQMQVDVKSVKVIIDVVYTQNGTKTKIPLPNTADSGILYTSNTIQTEIDTIHTAIENLKNDSIYSLDLTAKNEFDPGWNKNAIVDSYTARMYKNGDWFNHSYSYKAHSETDGKETYKYTLGNVNGTTEENQGTWLISRKSTNTQTPVANASANTQFDFLTAVVKQNASEIDCIKKEVIGTTTKYALYLGKTATKNLQKKIVDMINTNPYDEVIQLNNYFNSENVIKDACIEIVVKNDKLSSVVCETELCYTPIGGEYSEYNITLNNTIELAVNEKLSKAQNYAPPTKVKGTLGFGKNLNDSEYYIL